MNDLNRKTTIPVRTIPQIVVWLLKNCTADEIEFMLSLAEDKKRFTLLNSIFTRLTDYNVHEVFYGNVVSPEELYVKWSAKRGEVAGLKAFALACQQAAQIKKEKRVKKEGGEE